MTRSDSREEAEQEEVRDHCLGADDPPILIERSRRISRTALSDKTSRLHPRRAAAELGQSYEPEVPVEVREWIAPALASAAFVLEPQPPAQPHSHV
jgi:hypothetical protein